MWSLDHMDTGSPVTCRIVVKNGSSVQQKWCSQIPYTENPVSSSWVWRQPWKMNRRQNIALPPPQCSKTFTQTTSKVPSVPPLTKGKRDCYVCFLRTFCLHLFDASQHIKKQESSLISCSFLGLLKNSWKTTVNLRCIFVSSLLQQPTLRYRSLLYCKQG